jgi:hypothetical protein
MKAVRVAAMAVFISMGLTAAASPALAFNIHDGIKWGAVAGELTGYAAGNNANVSVTQTYRTSRRSAARSMHINLSLKTALRFADPNAAAPLVTPGDGVRIKLKWVDSQPHAVSFSYLPNGAIPSSTASSAELGTSRFFGKFNAVTSTASALNITNVFGGMETFALTPDTMYFEQGQQLANPTIANKTRLAVEATQQSDGSWSADAVFIGGVDNGTGNEPEDFSGLYSASTAGTMTMISKKDGSLQTFSVDRNTKYYDANGNPVSSLAYYANEPCHVIATQQSDGTWLASRIKVGSGDHGGDGMNHTFKVTFVSTDGTSLTVTDTYGNSETFSLDANTLYFDQTGNPVSSLSYTVGETLWVAASKQTDGSWLATSVSLKQPSGNGSKAQTEDFHGAYASNDATTLTLTNSDSTTTTFTVDANTTYFDQTGTLVSSLTYSVGEPLHVEATQQTDGTWLATMVVVSHAKSNDD